MEEIGVEGYLKLYGGWGRFAPLARRQGSAASFQRVGLNYPALARLGRRRKLRLGASRRGCSPRGGGRRGEQGTRGGPGRGGGGAGLARPRPCSRGHRARGCSSLTAGEVALAPRDVCLHSRGHGGAAAAASCDVSGLWPEPKAAAAAAAALLAASRSSARLGGRREAPNPRRGVPLLRGWTSLPRGGVPHFGRRPLPAPQQGQE